MTHFNTSLRLPVRTRPSPMEDAIVQQVEWYMGRLNLEKDEYLKHQMDDDLWVSLDVILNFPKMQRMGVQDKRRVATLLHARSTIVEVDEKTARIRPAWARRSTIVIHDVPTNARLDQVATLFQIPSNADLSNTSVPPTVSHPPGLISIQPAADTIWLAIFDSPTGAHDSVNLLLDKEINGQKVNPEVHVENPLRSSTESYRQSEPHPSQNLYQSPRSVDSPQPNSAPYGQVNPIMSMTNQVLSPMGMPLPVMHHPTQDAHPQYTYATPQPTYTPGYAPQNMAVPRQFMQAPRSLHAGYVMTYPQAGHPYDPSHAVPIQQHPMRTQQQQQQQQMDQNGPQILPSTPISAEGATTPQGTQTVPAVPNGVATMPASGEAHETVETAAEYVQDSGISQVQADAQRIAAQIPYTAAMPLPVMTGQPIDGQMMMPSQVKPVDMHYMHRAPMMGDPNVYGRGNGRQSGTGRDRNGQRNTDGSMRPSGRGSMMDGQRGSAMHRKGKKGNRNNTRHGHGHDRDRRDGKGDGSGSDSGNRDDRRYEKPKPEPNLASMHFPPLPMSDGAGGARPSPPKFVKKDEIEDKALSTASTSESKEAVPIGVDEDSATDTAKDATKIESTRNEGETAPPVKSTSDKDSASDDLTVSKEPKATVCCDQADTSTQDSCESKEGSFAPEGEKKSEPKIPSTPASSPMSYAAILRSKKPGAPPRPVQPSVSRSSSASGKNSESNSGSEASSSSTPHPPKEKSGRRRKSSSQRNSGHTGDTKDGNSASTGSKTEKSDKSDKNIDKHASDTPSSNESKDSVTGESENVRSKPVVESTRAHPVWVNKPKSLFQAASASPTVRTSTPLVPSDSKKATSPVSSQGDEKETSAEKGTNDAVDRTASDEQPNGQTASGSANEEGNDLNTNGIVENKDVPKVSMSKVTNSASKTSGDGSKNTKASKGLEKTANVSAKGAWAAGGPKTWPKNNGNGVIEKTSNTTES